MNIRMITLIKAYRRQLGYFLGICLINLMVLAGCAQPNVIKKAEQSLGTIVEITVADQDKPRSAIAKALDKSFSEIKRIEKLLSKFNAEGDIGRINSYGFIQPIRVSPETIKLLEQSISFSQLTDGCFDISVNPLLEIWGLAKGASGHYPSPEQLNAALNKVSYQNIGIIKEKQSVFLARPGMSLDLGGIAKGYAVDRAIAMLKQEGIQNALVNAGGDIYALGRPCAAKRWQVALQHPRKKDVFLAVLELEDTAVATSGDYQRYIEIDGRRYSHIVDPRTGIPCEDVPASVTVLTKDCLSADSLATSIFVLGPKKGIDLVNRLEGTEAIVVSLRDKEFDILLSHGMEKYIAYTTAKIAH